MRSQYTIVHTIWFINRVPFPVLIKVASKTYVCKNITIYARLNHDIELHTVYNVLLYLFL